MNVRRALEELRAPDEPAAQERAWSVVRSAYRERAAPAPRRSRATVVIAPIVAVLVAAVALSPAGASVRRLITRALSVPHVAATALGLPAPGTLLVSGAGGTWTVSHGGAARRLGPWTRASWSPHGRYVAVGSAGGLAAVTPSGSVAWRLAGPAARDARWFSPSGYRIAYRSGRNLDVVAGDGTGNAVLATGIASIAPAWRPAHPYQLAYVTERGALIVRDAAGGRVIGTAAPPPGRVLRVGWSADGDRLVAVTSRAARVYAPDGRLLSTFSPTGGSPIIGAAVSPDGRTVALVRGGAAGSLQVVDLAATRPVARTVLAGVGLRQPVWSPSGGWLLAAWPAADEWVFVRVAGGPRIVTVARIAGRFGSRHAAAGGAAAGAAPTVDGWCCSPSGGG